MPRELLLGVLAGSAEVAHDVIIIITVVVHKCCFAIDGEHDLGTSRESNLEDLSVSMITQHDLQ